MKISEKRSGELYEAMKEPIMRLRLQNCRQAPSEKELDELLFKLEQEIWKGIKRALNLNH